MLNEKLKEIFCNVNKEQLYGHEASKAIRQCFLSYLIGDILNTKCYHSGPQSVEASYNYIFGTFVKLIQDLVLNPIHYQQYGNETYIISVNDNCMLCFNNMQPVNNVLNTASFSIYTKDYDLYDKYTNIIKKYYNLNKEHNIYVIISDGNNLSLKNLNLPNNKLIEDNYTKNVIDDYKYICSEFAKNKPSGRLVILNGLPGTGKTNFCYSITNKLLVNNIFIYLPPFMVERLSSPPFIKYLFDVISSSKKNLNLIIEDADAILIKRGSDNLNAINSLLNLADGFLADALNIRIIATTNQKKMDFDPAIVRKMRLCKTINFDKLSIEQSNKIYQNLTKTNNTPFNAPQILADIYYAASNQEVNI